MKKLTILATTLLLATAWATTAAAATDWKFYASVRMQTFWLDQNFGNNLNPAGTRHSEQHLRWNLATNSRLGVKAKGEGAVSGRVELGLRDINTVYLRKIEGIWKFAPGMKLLVGQTYSPLQQFISGQAVFAGLGLHGIGAAYANRRPQIKLYYQGFSLAAVKPVTPSLETSGGTAAGGQPTAWLPKFETGYALDFDTWNLNFIGGFQTYRVDDVTSLKTGRKNDIAVTSWSLGVDGAAHFSRAYIKAGASWGVNVGSAGWDIPGDFSHTAGRVLFDRAQGAFALWNGDDGTDDIPTLMLAIIGGWAAGDRVRFEAGFGWRENDYSAAAAGFDDDARFWNIYGHAVIRAAPGVHFIPEVDYFDLGHDNRGRDNGTLWAVGGKWQIDF